MKRKQQYQLRIDEKNSNLETPVIPHLRDLIPSTPGTRSAKWDWDVRGKFRGQRVVGAKDPVQTIANRCALGFSGVNQWTLLSLEKGQPLKEWHQIVDSSSILDSAYILEWMEMEPRYQNTSNGVWLWRWRKQWVDREFVQRNYKCVNKSNDQCITLKKINKHCLPLGRSLVWFSFWKKREITIEKWGRKRSGPWAVWFHVIPGCS